MDQDDGWTATWILLRDQDAVLLRRERAAS